MRLPFLLLIAAMALAETNYGVKAGLRLTDDFRGVPQVSESKRYAIGWMIVHRLPLGFAIEQNTLYRRVGIRAFDTQVPGVSFDGGRGNSWETAILGRKHIWGGLYAGGGWVPRVMYGSGLLQSLREGTFDERRDFVLFTHGPLAVAGWERRFGPIRIGPEVRYTHWNEIAVERIGALGLSVAPARNQADFLLGVSF